MTTARPTDHDLGDDVQHKHDKRLEKMGISAEKCAEVTLCGVVRDKSIIPVTTRVHLIWRLGRVPPCRYFKMGAQGF